MPIQIFRPARGRCNMPGSSSSMTVSGFLTKASIAAKKWRGRIKWLLISPWKIRRVRKSFDEKPEGFRRVRGGGQSKSAVCTVECPRLGVGFGGVRGGGGFVVSGN